MSSFFIWLGILGVFLAGCSIKEFTQTGEINKVYLALFEGITGVVFIGIGSGGVM
jgi:hypothetical protein